MPAHNDERAALASVMSRNANTSTVEATLHAMPREQANCQIVDLLAASWRAADDRKANVMRLIAAKLAADLPPQQKD